MRTQLIKCDGDDCGVTLEPGSEASKGALSVTAFDLNTGANVQHDYCPACVAKTQLAQLRPANVPEVSAPPARAARQSKPR